MRKLLILHGGPGLSHKYLIPHLDFLKSIRDLVCVDYVGKSPEEIFDNLKSTMASLDAPFDIFAHSWGSSILFGLIKNFKLSGFDQVLFCNPCPETSTGLAESMDVLQQMILNRLTPSQIDRIQSLKPDENGIQDREMIEILKVCYVTNPKFVSQLDFSSYNRTLFMAVMEKMSLFDFTSELQKLKTHLTLILGENDFFKIDILDSIQKVADRTIVFEGVGHSPFIECSTLFQQAVLKSFSSDSTFV